MSGASTPSPKKLVIVGGGFGGLTLARELGNHPGYEITLIDRRNHHLFQPLLYQVATAGLSPADIAIPIRSTLSDRRSVRVILGEVTGIDLKKREVTTSDRQYAYDYLVLASGARHSYFGHPEWEEYAPGLKTIEHATEIRRRILLAFEEAEKADRPEEQKRLLTFVVVGGGPTGVELAGSLAEISRFTLDRDFRNVDPSRTRVILVESGQRVLGSFTPTLSRRALQDLEHLGVQVWTSSRVTEITSAGVQIGNDFITSSHVFWAAGVQASPLGKLLNTELDSSGRVITTPQLRHHHHSEVFIIGDLAHVKAFDGNPLPGLAPVAIQQGRYLAKMLKRTHKNPRLVWSPFRYVDKGTMATIGRKKAVLRYGLIEGSGFTAWALWLAVHIFFLIGFRNRVAVFLQWAWSYVTYKRGARLIVSRDWMKS